MAILIIVLFGGVLIFLMATKRISGSALLRAVFNSLVSVFWLIVGVAVLFGADGAVKLLGLLAIGYAVYGITTHLDWHEVWLGTPGSKYTRTASTGTPVARVVSSGAATAAPAAPPEGAESVLAALKAAGSADIETLAEATGRTNGEVSGALDSLLKAGLVNRERGGIYHPRDHQQ